MILSIPIIVVSPSPEILFIPAFKDILKLPVIPASLKVNKAIISPSVNRVVDFLIFDIILPLLP